MSKVTTPEDILSAAHRFMILFAGHPRASGAYSIPTSKPGSPKSDIRSSARTVSEPASEGKWCSHLRGGAAAWRHPYVSDG